MRLSFKLCTPLLIGVSFLSACTVHAGYYDPYYHDRHPWNGEVVYYGQWEQETHREHRDIKARPESEQKEYWDWRHKHDDHH